MFLGDCICKGNTDVVVDAQGYGDACAFVAQIVDSAVVKEIAEIGNEPDVDGVRVVAEELLRSAVDFYSRKVFHRFTIKYSSIEDLHPEVRGVGAFQYVLKLVCYHCFERSDDEFVHVGNGCIVGFITG